MATKSDDVRRRNRRGESAIGDSGNPEDLLGEAEDLFPGDVEAESAGRPLDLDLDELIERGLLTRDGHNPDSGTAYLESLTGINHDRAWTADRDAEADRRKVRGQYVYVGREIAPYLRALFAGRDRRSQKVLWKEMLWLTGKARQVLIEVRSERFGKTWLGVFNAEDCALGVEKLLYLICSDVGNGMVYDFNSTGVGEFELFFVAAFSRLEDCLLYREFLLNRRLDEGWLSYNENEVGTTVKRLVAVELRPDLVSTLLALSQSRGLRIKEVVSKLVNAWIRRESERKLLENQREKGSMEIAYRVGFIGVGVVGGALLRAFEEFPRFQVRAYDKYREGLQDVSVIADTDLCFISVPTPTNKDWTQNTLNIEDALFELVGLNYQGIVVVKSTVLPGTCRRLAQESGLRVVHFPEFLKEANPYEGFIEARDHALSGAPADTQVVANALRLRFDTAVIHEFPEWEVTEFAKYTHNSYLASKVAYFNQVASVCSQLDIAYLDVMKVVHAIGKVGKSHTMVPGPDKRPGFSGMCFVKDTATLFHWSQELECPLTILEAAIAYNIKIRPEAYDGRERTGLEAMDLSDETEYRVD